MALHAALLKAHRQCGPVVVRSHAFMLVHGTQPHPPPHTPFSTTPQVVNYLGKEGLKVVVEPHVYEEQVMTRPELLKFVYSFTAAESSRCAEDAGRWWQTRMCVHTHELS